MDDTTMQPPADLQPGLQVSSLLVYGPAPQEPLAAGDTSLPAATTTDLGVLADSAGAPAGNHDGSLAPPGGHPASEEASSPTTLSSLQRAPSHIIAAGSDFQPLAWTISLESPPGAQPPPSRRTHSRTLSSGQQTSRQQHRRTTSSSSSAISAFQQQAVAAPIPQVAPQELALGPEPSFSSPDWSIEQPTGPTLAAVPNTSSTQAQVPQLLPGHATNTGHEQHQSRGSSLEPSAPVHPLDDADLSRRSHSTAQSDVAVELPLAPHIDLVPAQANQQADVIPVSFISSQPAAATRPSAEHQIQLPSLQLPDSEDTAHPVVHVSPHVLQPSMPTSPISVAASPGPGGLDGVATSIRSDDGQPLQTNSTSQPGPKGWSGSCLALCRAHGPEIFRGMVSHTLFLATYAVDITVLVVLVGAGWSGAWWGPCLCILITPTILMGLLILMCNGWLSTCVEHFKVLLRNETQSLLGQRWYALDCLRLPSSLLLLAIMSLFGTLVMMYCILCFTLTAVGCVPLLDASTTLASMLPFGWPRFKARDLLLVEQYKTTRYAVQLFIQSLPQIVVTSLAAVHARSLDRSDDPDNPSTSARVHTVIIVSLAVSAVNIVDKGWLLAEQLQVAISGGRKSDGSVRGKWTKVVDWVRAAGEAVGDDDDNDVDLVQEDPKMWWLLGGLSAGQAVARHFKHLLMLKGSHRVPHSVMQSTLSHMLKSASHFVVGPPEALATLPEEGGGSTNADDPASDQPAQPSNPPRPRTRLSTAPVVANGFNRVEFNSRQSGSMLDGLRRGHVTLVPFFIRHFSSSRLVPAQVLTVVREAMSRYPRHAITTWAVEPPQGQGCLSGVILDGVLRFKALQQLTICKCNVSGAGFKRVFRQLSTHPALCDLRLTKVVMDAAATAALADFLRDTTLLTRLDMHLALLPTGTAGTKVLARLARALKTNKSITTLTISSCGLQRQGLQALCGALSAQSSSSGLRYLDVSGNATGLPGGQILADLITALRPPPALAPAGKPKQSHTKAGSAIKAGSTVVSSGIQGLAAAAQHRSSFGLLPWSRPAAAGVTSNDVETGLVSPTQTTQTDMPTLPSAATEAAVKGAAALPDAAMPAAALPDTFTLVVSERDITLQGAAVLVSAVSRLVTAYQETSSAAGPTTLTTSAPAVKQSATNTTSNKGPLGALLARVSTGATATRDTSANVQVITDNSRASSAAVAGPMIPLPPLRTTPATAGQVQARPSALPSPGSVGAQAASPSLPHLAINIEPELTVIHENPPACFPGMTWFNKTKTSTPSTPTTIVSPPSRLSLQHTIPAQPARLSLSQPSPEAVAVGQTLDKAAPTLDVHADDVAGVATAQTASQGVTGGEAAGVPGVAAGAPGVAAAVGSEHVGQQSVQVNDKPGAGATTATVPVQAAPAAAAASARMGWFKRPGSHRRARSDVSGDMSTMLSLAVIQDGAGVQAAGGGKATGHSSKGGTGLKGDALAGVEGAGAGSGTATPVLAPSQAEAAAQAAATAAAAAKALELQQFWAACSPLEEPAPPKAPISLMLHDPNATHVHVQGLPVVLVAGPEAPVYSGTMNRTATRQARGTVSRPVPSRANFTDVLQQFMPASTKTGDPPSLAGSTSAQAAQQAGAAGDTPNAVQVVMVCDAQGSRVEVQDRQLAAKLAAHTQAGGVCVEGLVRTACTAHRMFGPHLVSLDLSNMQLGDSGAILLAELLLFSPGLQSLSAAGNGITDVGACALLTSLRCITTSFTSTCDESPHAPASDVEAAAATATEAVKLSKAVASHEPQAAPLHPLRLLDVSNNALCDDSAQALCALMDSMDLDRSELASAAVVAVVAADSAAASAEAAAAAHAELLASQPAPISKRGFAFGWVTSGHTSAVDASAAEVKVAEAAAKTARTAALAAISQLSQALQRKSLLVQMHANHYPFSMASLRQLQTCLDMANQLPTNLQPYLNATAPESDALTATQLTLPHGQLTISATEPEAQTVKQQESEKSSKRGGVVPPISPWVPSCSQLMTAMLQAAQFKPTAHVVLNAPSRAAKPPAGPAQLSDAVTQALGGGGRAGVSGSGAAGRPPVHPTSQPPSLPTSSALANHVIAHGRSASHGQGRHSRTPSHLTDGSEGDVGCAVCFDNPNNLTIRDCGHKLCVSCYRQLVKPSMSSSATARCPFCRQTIQGFEYRLGLNFGNRLQQSGLLSRRA